MQTQATLWGACEQRRLTLDSPRTLRNGLVRGQRENKASPQGARTWHRPAYRQTYITDDHHFWMRGLPFLGEFLRRSWALQAQIKLRSAMHCWYEELGVDLDDSGRLTVTRFLAEMDDAVIRRPEKG